MAKRGRPRKNENAEAAEPNGVGHNSEMTDEQRKALTFQHKKRYSSLLEAKKAADAAFKNGCKLAKSELGADAIDLIKDMIALESEDGEAKIKAAIERQRRAAAYMGAPLGSQLALFDEPDRTPAVDRARAEGERDGMEAKPLDNPYAHDLPQHEAYAEGWNSGQRAIFNIQPLESGAAAH